jgi:hypothetical protein
MADQIDIDTNMIPGQTYTFKLSLDNLVTSPSTSKVQADLQNNAPSFVNNNLIVTEESGSVFHPLTNIYDIQFTYNGDGSDVISDVASAIVATVKSGSNDDFTFVGAYADSAGSVNTDSGVSGAIKSAGDTFKQTLDQAMGGITSVVNDASKQAAKSAQDVLTPIEIAVAIVVGLVVLLIFTTGKSGGGSAGPEGVSIGGSK